MAALHVASRRTQKKAEVRDALVDAADRLFAAQGFDNTTVDDIAEVAGVSRRTFFRYFPTKEAIAFPHSEARLEAFRQLLSARPPGTLVFDSVRDACLTLAKTFMADRESELERQRIVDKSPTLLAADLQLYQSWADAVAEAAAPKGANARQRRRARMFAAATIGVIRSTLTDWMRSGARKNLVPLGKEAFEILGSGFANLEFDA